MGKMSIHISELQANLNNAWQNQDQIRNEKIQSFRDTYTGLQFN